MSDPPAPSCPLLAAVPLAVVAPSDLVPVSLASLLLEYVAAHPQGREGVWA